MKKFILVLLLVLVCCLDCNLKRENNFPENLPNASTFTVYIDEDFSSAETKIILSAFTEWETATRGIVKFISAGTIRVENKSVNEYDKNIIVRTTSSDEFLLNEYHERQILGYEVPQVSGHFFVAIVADRMKNASSYKTNVIHELGHAVGLQHDDSDSAIMNSLQDKFLRCLTKTDLIQFCKLYSCDVSQLNYCDPNNVSNQMFN